MAKIEAYTCDVCQSIYLTSKQSKDCVLTCTKRLKEAREHKRKQAEWKKAKDYIRLNCESIYDIPEMLSGFVKHHMNRVFVIRKFDIRFSYIHRPGHPIGHPYTEENQEFLGWGGNVTGETDVYGDPVIVGGGITIKSPFDILKYGTNGIHTGTGSGGDDFQFGFYMYLDDFPILKKKYEEYKKLSIKKEYFEAEKEQRLNRGKDLILNDPDVKKTSDNIRLINEVYLPKIYKSLDEQKKSVIGSDRYIKTTTVPKRFAYDEDKFVTLNKQFRR